MNIFEFMAKMLYFLPDKNEKSIRYYGLYYCPAKKIKNILKESRASWAFAIEYCFNKNPKKCPECRIDMEEHTVKSFQKYLILKDLRDNYILIDGYFYPYFSFNSKCFLNTGKSITIRGP